MHYFFLPTGVPHRTCHPHWDTRRGQARATQQLLCISTWNVIVKGSSNRWSRGLLSNKEKSWFCSYYKGTHRLLSGIREGNTSMPASLSRKLVPSSALGVGCFLTAAKLLGKMTKPWSLGPGWVSRPPWICQDESGNIVYSGDVWNIAKEQCKAELTNGLSQGGQRECICCLVSAVCSLMLFQHLFSTLSLTGMYVHARHSPKSEKKSIEGFIIYLRWHSLFTPNCFFRVS